MTLRPRRSAWRWDGHDSARTRLERAVGAVGLQFVILDEVDLGRSQRVNQRRGRLRRKTHAGFDDRADQRTGLYLRQPTRPGNAELRTRVGLRKGAGQTDIQQAQSGKLRQLKQVAGDHGDQVRQRRAQVLQRPGQHHTRPADDGPVLARRHACAGQAWGHTLFHHFQRFDPGTTTGLQFGGLAGHRHERAAGLLAGHGFGRGPNAVSIR